LAEDDKRGGCPKSIQTEVNIVAVDLVKKDHQITSRMIAESLNIPKTVVLQILKEDFCFQDFYLLHNIPTHKAGSVCQFLTHKNVTTLYHPLYSPDLSQQTIFCSPS
jgi:hypothetical protein